MDKIHFNEMVQKLDELIHNGLLENKTIYLFGHCNASEELLDLLIQHGYTAAAILDNSSAKQGSLYKSVPIILPECIMGRNAENTVVLIAARAYAAMYSQLRRNGYGGAIVKMVEYDSFSEYSLSDETLHRMNERLLRGIDKLNKLKEKYPDCFVVLCPFSALGDTFYIMSYLPYFLSKRGIERYVVCVVGKGCVETAEMFAAENIEMFRQSDIDEIIQAALFTEDEDCYIFHHDRPYIVKLSKVLYVKKVSLEDIFKCGVFGLPIDTKPYKPINLKPYKGFDKLKKGKSVIIAPYAKSVTNIPKDYWYEVINRYNDMGYKVFTNAVGEEETLEGTARLEIPLAQMQSAVEYAGTFIGLRSGLCDVIQYADCKKIALYPDCCYSDTKWKMEEIYHLDGWENMVIKGE